MTMPGEPHWGLGQCGVSKLFVYVTWPVAGASGTEISPVVLKPCELEREIETTRTRIGALPGWAWISTSFSLKGAALATSVTDADGMNTAAAKSARIRIVAAVT